jgi:hypothetical protein
MNDDRRTIAELRRDVMAAACALGAIMASAAVLHLIGWV